MLCLHSEHTQFSAAPTHHIPINILRGWHGLKAATEESQNWWEIKWKVQYGAPMHITEEIVSMWVCVKFKNKHVRNYSESWYAKKTFKYRVQVFYKIKCSHLTEKQKHTINTEREWNSWKVRQRYNENIMNKAQKCQRWFTRLRQKGARGHCGFAVIGRGVTHILGSERHRDKQRMAEDQSVVASPAN